jgi:hypothetical protein
LLGLAVEAFAVDPVADKVDVLSSDLVAMRRGIDQLEAQFSRRLVAFDAVRGYEIAGAADLTSWLRSAFRMGTSAAARRLHLARQLTELPETEAAWRSGAISAGHAAVIGRTVDDVGTEVACAVTGPQDASVTDPASWGAAVYRRASRRSGLRIVSWNGRSPPPYSGSIGLVGEAVPTFAD